MDKRDQLGVKPGRLFVNGTWRDGSEGAEWTHVHPATNEEVITFALASVDDVDEAMLAARRAFDDRSPGAWSTWKAKDRQRLLQRIAQLINDHGDELDRLQTLYNRLPLSFAAI